MPIIYNTEHFLLKEIRFIQLINNNIKSNNFIHNIICNY